MVGEDHSGVGEKVVRSAWGSTRASGLPRKAAGLLSCASQRTPARMSTITWGRMPGKCAPAAAPPAPCRPALHRTHPPVLPSPLPPPASPGDLPRHQRDAQAHPAAVRLLLVHDGLPGGEGAPGCACMDGLGRRSGKDLERGGAPRRATSRAAPRCRRRSPGPRCLTISHLAPHLCARQGALYASRSTSESQSTVVYRPFESWAQNSDWTLTLPSEQGGGGGQRTTCKLRGGGVAERGTVRLVCVPGGGGGGGGISWPLCCAICVVLLLPKPCLNSQHPSIS